MKTLQQKKDCIKNVLSTYQNQLSEQIESLNEVSDQDEYDNFITEITTLLAKSHKDLLAKIQLCQNTNGPSEIQESNIN
ncbi:hypothetical protein [Flavobacterium sp.]|jgi:hypothetical protein|uniref:hypothetical protein n=1 Tax=Flavobacterium sp. TaxID=239 RepID=UPI0037BF213A